jgi:hypothetical protein
MATAQPPLDACQSGPGTSALIRTKPADATLREAESAGPAA